ncbi:MAG TPA: DNA polymerase III subunit alpha [Candidatus Binatia bacterium]|nr:DNA polymerase III subunit alpha [Candidatus Binatia bacterium]
MSFVHLRVHTEFSLVDGTIRLERPDARQGDAKQRHLEPRFLTLAEQAAQLKYPAVAVTDLGNLFAAVKFYKTAEARGVKPILGADVTIAARTANEAPERVTLLVAGPAGYANLVRLLSLSFTQGQERGQPLVKREWLDAHVAGLIVLCGARSEIGRLLLGGNAAGAHAVLKEWQGRCGDRVYLEITRCGRAEDEPHLRGAVSLARHAGAAVVATNDVRFLRRSDFEAHEARVCIAQGFTLDDPRRPRDYTAEQYLKSAAEMQERFADLPEALANSVEIARRCTLSLKFGVHHLPDFPVPAGETAASFLRREALSGLERRLAATPPKSGAPAVDHYFRRLDHELGIIEKMGFSGYFLVVADFIAWGKSHGVPVGPGRGSGAGSLVAYATGITDLDPLPYDLLFERFLNPERVSLPDFDVDFCMLGRDRVIEYVAERYGRERVGQIITYGTMAARAVVRDIARVLGHPYGMGDRIAKMIPGGPQAMDLADALDEVPELKAAYKSEDDVAAIVDLGLQLEGMTRNVGKHAGGVVIAPRALTDFAPLFCEPGGGGLVTQFDMKDLEEVGLVKFDFLGLKTLTIIEAAVRRIDAKRAPGEPPLDILKIPLDDRATYQLYAGGHTTAVFQMESGGMQRASVDLRPDTFEDIIALISLYRPGPMELIPDFVARKHGRARITYLHPDMEEVLKPTYGIFVYQEQVMQVARKLAGYTLGGADLLRRAMGKKKPEEMAQQREVFLAGCEKNGIRAAVAAQVFDLIEKFAGYGFNKSHAAAYALVSYQTAWLKTHYPADFMAAVLSCDMDKTDSVVMMIDECRRMGLTVLPPDIHRSAFPFTVVGPDAIAYGLGAVKGAGEGALAGVLQERDGQGPFKDLFDLCRRIDLRRTNKRVLEALIGCGALDAFGVHRAALMQTLPRAMALAEQAASTLGTGQVDMFGLAAPASGRDPLIADCPEWPDLERLRMEKETLGLYLSGHPVEMYRGALQQICPGTIKAQIEARSANALLGGWVVDLRRFGKRFVLTLDDRTAQISCILGEDFLASRAPPRKDTLLFVQGRIAPDEFTGGWRVFANDLLDLDQVQARFAERVLLDFRDAAPDLRALGQALQPLRDPQGCPVTVKYLQGTARTMLDLGPDWRIRVQDAGLEPLKQLLGADHVQVTYRRPSLAPTRDAA